MYDQKLRHGQKFAAAKLRIFAIRKIGFTSRVPCFKKAYFLISNFKNLKSAGVP
jgi:hypothetical protein